GYRQEVEEEWRGRATSPVRHQRSYHHERRGSAELLQNEQRVFSESRSGERRGSADLLRDERRVELLQRRYSSPPREIIEPPPDYSPGRRRRSRHTNSPSPSPPPPHSNRKSNQKTRFADPAPQKTKSSFGDSLRRFVGKFRSSDEKKQKRKANSTTSSPSRSYRQQGPENNNIPSSAVNRRHQQRVGRGESPPNEAVRRGSAEDEEVYTDEEEGGMTSPVPPPRVRQRQHSPSQQHQLDSRLRRENMMEPRRFYLGEDPFGGSIYGREKEYDGVTPPARSSRNGRHHSHRSRRGSQEDHNNSQGRSVVWHEEAYLESVRSNQDVRLALRSGSGFDSPDHHQGPDSTVVNVHSEGPRIVHQSRRSRRVVDTDDKQELSRVQNGHVVTETRRTTDHEEERGEQVPEEGGAASEEEHETNHREGTHRYAHTKEQDLVQYIGSGGRKIAEHMRYSAENVEGGNEGDPDPEWDSLSTRMQRMRRHQPGPAAVGSPLADPTSAESAAAAARKDALTKRPLDFDQEEETRKVETSKWLEHHFGSDSRSSKSSIDDEQVATPSGAHFINVTMKSRPINGNGAAKVVRATPSPRPISPVVTKPVPATTFSPARVFLSSPEPSVEPVSLVHLPPPPPAPVLPTVVTPSRLVNGLNENSSSSGGSGQQTGYFQGVTEWSDRSRNNVRGIASKINARQDRIQVLPTGPAHTFSSTAQNTRVNGVSSFHSSRVNGTTSPVPAVFNRVSSPVHQSRLNGTSSPMTSLNSSSRLNGTTSPPPSLTTQHRLNGSPVTATVSNSSTLGRYSRSAGRLHSQIEEGGAHRSTQTLPRKLSSREEPSTRVITSTTTSTRTSAHTPVTRSASHWESSGSRLTRNQPNTGSLINVSIVNNVTPSSITAGPAKPARTYRSSLARSQSFNVTANEVPPPRRLFQQQQPKSSSYYRSNPHIHRLEDSSSPLKSPGIISSISRSQRDLSEAINREALIEEEESKFSPRMGSKSPSGLNGTGITSSLHESKKKLFMKGLLDRAPELYRTLHGDEAGTVSPGAPRATNTQHRVEYSNSFRGSDSLAPGVRPARTRRSTTSPPTSLSSPNALHNGDSKTLLSPSQSFRSQTSNNGKDYSETVRYTSTSDDPLRPSVTNTVQSFSKKTVASPRPSGGVATETIESTETTTVTKSRIRDPQSTSFVSSYSNNALTSGKNKFSYDQPIRNGGVVIEVRNNNR
ncbi:hypothetical protein B566_EDAN016996, partial [Ephemera danica]